VQVANFFYTRESFGLFICHKMCPTISESQGLRPLLPLLCILLMLDMLVSGVQCLSAYVNIFQVTPARLVKALQRPDYSIGAYTHLID